MEKVRAMIYVYILMFEVLFVGELCTVYDKVLLFDQIEMGLN